MKISKNKSNSNNLFKDISLGRLPSDFFTNQIEQNFKDAADLRHFSSSMSMEKKEKKERKKKINSEKNEISCCFAKEEKAKKKKIFSVANKNTEPIFEVPENREKNKTLLDFIMDTESGIPMKEKEIKDIKTTRKAKEKESRNNSSISHEFLEKKREKEKKEMSILFKPKIIIEDGNTKIIAPNYSEINKKFKNDKGYNEGGIVETFERNKLTSMSFRKNKIHSDKWTDEETEIFYKSLSYFGTDFSVLEIILRPRKRNQIKNKFRKEEKKYPQKVENALKKFSPAHIEKFFAILRLYNNKEESYDTIDFHKLLEENFDQFKNVDLTNVPDLPRERSNSFSLSSKQVSYNLVDKTSKSKFNSSNPIINPGIFAENMDQTESDDSLPVKKHPKRGKKLKKNKSNDSNELNNLTNNNLKNTSASVPNSNLIEVNRKKSEEISNKSLFFNLFNQKN